MNIPMNIHNAEKVLLEIKELMDELNVIFFLRHGTCLGAVRDGELIKWDDDLDIGSIIGMNGLGKKSIYETVDKFRLAGFEVEVGESPGHIGVTLWKFGITIDWSCYRIIQGSIYQYPASKIPAKLHDDLKPISFLGTTFLVPNPPEEYFLLKYGSEWQTPKKVDYESDVINLIPESVILQQPSIFTRIHKLFFPNKYITKIRILTHDNKPVELAKVTLVGIGKCTTDHEGYAKFNLLSKRLHFEDLYAVIIEKEKEKEILYLEILKPGINYYYLPSNDQTSGRSYVLQEER
tara:strand:+ start:1076 stop:1951 length:876 start_codon:yes stop_codon:yes gene_type:complete